MGYVFVKVHRRCVRLLCEYFSSFSDPPVSGVFLETAFYGTHSLLGLLRQLSLEGHDDSRSTEVLYSFIIISSIDP